ncbi:transposase [Roseateles sp. MS654]|uniref:transposase n=1 Tax=Roseateles sp. MS654 TaxID=3412685 RepID=UPI003C2CF977
MYQLTGTDLTAIHGLGPSISLSLVAECGTDLSKWPTEKHFTSWLCLSPRCKISGGKVLSARTRKSSSRLARSYASWRSTSAALRRPSARSTVAWLRGSARPRP